VIAIDTNILVYAHRADSGFHSQAKACVERAAQSLAPWAVPWPCLHEFYAIVTHLRIYNPPTPPDRAIEQIEIWLESPSLVLLAESGGHWPQLKTLLQRAKTAGPAVHDARIAALCLVHGVSELWSADRDFSRFPALKTANPLVS
jgi:uncharacterized protein